MSYSDGPSPRWDRIAAVVVWLVLGFLGMELLSYEFIADCLSEPCTPSLELRILGLVVTSFSAAALPAFASAALIRRLFFGSSH